MLLTRRNVLGAGAAAALLAACGDKGGSPAPTAATGSTTAATAGAAAATDLTVADFTALGTCALLPEKTAGPFPLDEQFDRRDITEGYPGTAMRLGFRVVDGGCAAVPGAVVEVWHCDATGDYSAFADGGGGKDEAEGTTFLRGSQTANDDGIVEFLTIVPGWYRGRAVHVHLRVHLDGGTVLTSQAFFDADFLDEVYAAEPYAEFGPPDTPLAADGIAGDAAAEGTILHTTLDGGGTVALLNLGVETS
jgi:protocatechuate 3,4-dioxygenase beta subunit